MCSAKHLIPVRVARTFDNCIERGRDCLLGRIPGDSVSDFSKDHVQFYTIRLEADCNGEPDNLRTRPKRPPNVEVANFPL